MNRQTMNFTTKNFKGRFANRMVAYVVIFAILFTITNAISLGDFVNVSAATYYDEYIAAPFTEYENDEPFLQITPFNGDVYDVSDADELAFRLDIAENGVPMTIRLTESFAMNAMFTVGAGIDITIISDNQEILTSVNNARHFVINAGGVLRLSNVILSGSSPTVLDAHGGVTVNAGGYLYMEAGGVIENARASSGGGVQLNNATLTINGGTIRNNVSTSTGSPNAGGGGINAVGAGSHIFMNGGTISGNASATPNANNSGGGGVRIYGGQFVMTTGAISGNMASNPPAVLGRYGGGVLVAGDGSFTMEGGTINGNTARAGGGVNLQAGAFTMEGGTISGNIITGTTSALTDGGGGVRLNDANSRFYMRNNSVIASHELTLSNNQLGAGIMMIAGRIYLYDDIEIIGNKVISNNNGGGIHVANGTLTMNGGEIVDNEAQQGGGLNLNGGFFVLNEGRIEDNTARTAGGGMRIGGAQVTLYGGVIYDNEAGTTGGGIHLATSTASRLFIYEDAIISYNIANTTGGGINTTGGRTYLRGGLIHGNEARGAGTTGNGGGVNIAPSGGSVPVFIMENGTISGNEGHQGGGVSISSGANLVFRMDGGDIVGNTAHDQGGGVNINAGTFTMNNGMIEDNTARNHGGGIRMSGGGALNLHNGEIYDNTAERSGGGIHTGTANANRLYIHENMTIHYNRALDGSGGGVNINAGTTYLHGTISNNESSLDGGGVQIARGDPSVTTLTATIDGATFSGNTSHDGAGGGINLNAGTFTIENSLFEDNHAHSRGGGMRIGSTEDITLADNIIIRDNTTNGAGGGIFVGSSFTNTLYIHNGVTIHDNEGNHGGGIYIRGGTVDMHGGVIRDNTARVNGGGVVISVSALVQPGGFTMRDGSVIRDNTAGANGGGVHAHGINDTFTMLGGIISNNTAHNGGGVSVRNAHANIEGNSTITGNTAINNGGGIWLADHTNGFYMHGGSLMNNHAAGDGGAIFANPTRTDNPLVNPANVYPRIHLIADSVDFYSNTAGGGLVPTPTGWNEITRFNGMWLTNNNINFRSNWRIVFQLLGGIYQGNMDDITFLIEASDPPIIFYQDEYAFVPVPIQAGYNFLGWRNRESEPDWDEDWDGDFSDYIWTHEEVEEHLVGSSAIFEAVWAPIMFTITYEVLGDVAPISFTPDIPAESRRQMGATNISVAQTLTTTETMNGSLIGIWTFSGWITEDVAMKGSTFTMPEHDVVFTGYWTFTSIYRNITGYVLYDGWNVFNQIPTATVRLYNAENGIFARETTASVFVNNGRFVLENVDASLTYYIVIHKQNHTSVIVQNVAFDLTVFNAGGGTDPALIPDINYAITSRFVLFAGNMDAINDDEINTLDWSLLVNSMFQAHAQALEQDLNDDYEINVLDQSLLLNNFLQTSRVYQHNSLDLIQNEEAEAQLPFGVWWWRHEVLGMQHLEFAAEQGINEIYMSMGWRNNPTNWREDTAEIISAAREKGIDIYYLTGDWSWIHNPDRLIERLEQFVYYQEWACEDTRFAGIHLNIEPHQDPTWRNGDANRRNELLQLYIDMKLQVTDIFGPMDWSIPWWWRSQSAYHLVEYRGEMEWLYRASIIEADRIFVMSYRNTAQAMYDIARHYVEFANEMERPIFLSALAHYGGENPNLGNVFFYFRGHEYMMRELDSIREIVNHSNLGIAIHDIRGWHRMWQRDF
ncbi:MAG: hypothetical protein FWE04_01025 [Oscillospiraceae bacterium]|nr:hypothetical protein [Oscillospiraceae bacterium]